MSNYTSPFLVTLTPDKGVLVSFDTLNLILNYAFLFAFTLIMIQIYRDTKHKNLKLLQAIANKKWQTSIIVIAYIGSYFIIDFLLA